MSVINDAAVMNVFITGSFFLELFQRRDPFFDRRMGGQEMHEP
jgi:hypothetical protein